MSMKLLFGALAAGVGVALSVQNGINSALAKHVGSALFGAAVSFAVGTAVLIAAVLVSGEGGLVGRLREVPPLYLTGGFLGAFAVASSVWLVPRLGVAALMVVVVAGQLVAAILVDHFGLFGVPQHSIGWARVLGVLLAIAGITLVPSRARAAA